MCFSFTTKKEEEDESRIFKPAASVLNQKTTRRMKRTYWRKKVRTTLLYTLKTMAVAGIPIIFIVFNIIFFTIGSSGYSEIM